MKTKNTEFIKFKEDLIAKNETKVGDQLRIKYGDDVVVKSEDTLRKMTEIQYDKFLDLQDEISSDLKQLSKNPDEKKLANKIVKNHQKWLKIAGGRVVTESEHKDIAEMYLTEQRFADFYNKSAKTKKAAQLLHDAIFQYYL